MALANDPAFLIYQLRVSFLRSNDPAGERILTFDDLSIASPSAGLASARQGGGGTPSPLTTPPAGRRNTSASEVRNHVAQNAAANPYIAASGYYPETEAVGSPEIEYDEGYMYQRPAAPRWGVYGSGGGSDGVDMPTPSARHLPDRAGHAGRNKRSNRSAKVAPTTGGGGQVVGVGVVPQDHEMILADIEPRGDAHDIDQTTTTRRSLDTVRPNPLPVLQEVAHSSGSLSDGGGSGGISSRDQDADPDSRQDWTPKPIVVPPRRSLDTINHQRSESSALRPTATERRRQQGHTHSNSVATIRLQRPAEMLRKGSSRDAIALGIDFDVKTIFEKGASGGQQSIYDLQYQSPQSRPNPGTLLGRIADTSSGSTRVGGIDGFSDDAESVIQQKEQQQQQEQQLQGREGGARPAKKSAGSIELRAKRGELTFKLPLANVREDPRFGAGSGGLKRSVTLPTRRNGPGAFGPGGGIGGPGAASNAARRSKWAGAYAFGRKQQQQQQQGANQASGWVGGANHTSWDHSSDEDDDGTDASVPFSRRGGGTQTWYGPRAGFRPISMFPAPNANPQFPIPPVPLMFGADDSDDDIDLEGDEGSSRTPALLGVGLGLGLGRGIRPQAASPGSSIRSRGDSVGVALEKPRAANFVPKPSALATTRLEASPLSATLATPTVVSASKYSHLTQDAASTLRPRGISDPEGRQSSRGSRSGIPGELHSGAGSGIDEPQLAMVVGPGSASRQDPLRPVSSSGDMLMSSRALEFRLDGVGSGRQLQHRTDSTGGDRVAMSVFVPPPPPKTSGLGALLSGKVEVRVNPFSEEFSTVGGNNNSNNSNILEVSLGFVQHEDRKSAPLKIYVRRNATVEQAVGFALFQYIEQGIQPQLADDAQDVVMWVLRIVEDGEVDDDLPALERTRPVANFAFDDMALCLATPDQVKQNECVRERLGRPPRMVRPKSLTPPTPASASNAPKILQHETLPSAGAASRDTRYKTMPRPQPTPAVLQVSRMATASLAGIFVGNSLLDRRKTSLLPPLTKGAMSNQSMVVVQDNASTEVVAALCEPRLLKIRILGEAKSAEESLRATTVETDTGATMGMVLAQVCRKKPFSEDYYVLGAIRAAGFVVFDSEMRVSQIPKGAELCLYKVGAAQAAADVAEADAQESELAPIYGQQQRAGEGSAAAGAIEGEAGEGAMSSVYYTFRVFRRAQMFTRHERSLVIDGGVVTLMPAGHRTESAKTLTFHVSNIICKRNQKSPKKIRLFVTRRANTGEKSIDLEATTEDEATNICTVLTRMHEYYQHGA
ncbi:Component of a membrane-bound complex containing the Tor2p kinase [Coemansia sp. RSA 2399]|nr:Component of a membrane-bound complex containing the Tor2p kinase [Coemansia sp. RSA 2399]